MATKAHDWNRTRAIWRPLPRLLVAAVLMAMARRVLKLGWWLFDRSNRMAPK